MNRARYKRLLAQIAGLNKQWEALIAPFLPREYVKEFQKQHRKWEASLTERPIEEMSAAEAAILHKDAEALRDEVKRLRDRLTTTRKRRRGSSSTR
jgi:ubiquinone biosynthesis protein UbiJ